MFILVNMLFYVYIYSITNYQIPEEEEVTNKIVTLPIESEQNIIQSLVNPDVEYIHNDILSLTLKRLKSNTDCSKIEAGKPTEKYPKILKKTIFSGPKFYFFVGLEGTGHHFFEQFCMQEVGCQDFDWLNVRHIPKLFPFGYADYRTGLFGSEKRNFTDFENKRQFFRNSIDKLKVMYLKSNKYIFVNSISLTDNNIGEMSYPNYDGPCKVLQYPDIRLLAELFEEAEFDFRIVVLTRNPLEIIISTAIKRQFMEWKEACKTYTEMVEEVIYKQLNRVERSFFSCIDYNKLPYFRPEFREFVDIPNFDNIVEKVYRPGNKIDHDSLRQQYRNETETVEFQKFEQSSQRFAEFCYEE